MADEVAAVVTETAPAAPVVEQPAAQPAAPAERPKPTLESTFSGVDWGTVPQETREALQAEVDRRIEVARKNAAARAKKETEAFYRGRESVRPAGEQPPPKQEAPPEDKPPTREQFATWEEFQEKKAEWVADRTAKAHVDKREKDAADAAAREKTQAAQRDFQTKVRTKFPDIDVRLEAVGDKPMHNEMQNAISESEFAADIFNEVISKDGELDRLYKLSPTAAVKEIGRLEARFEAAQKKPDAEAAPRKEAKPSNAPAPIDPVGGKAVSGDAEPSHDKPNEWAAWRNRQVAARKRGTSARA